MLTKAALAQHDDDSSSSASVYTSSTSSDEGSQAGLGNTFKARNEDKTNDDDVDSVDADYYDSDEERLNRMFPESFVIDTKMKKVVSNTPQQQTKQKTGIVPFGVHTSPNGQLQPSPGGSRDDGVDLQTRQRRKTFYNEPLDVEDEPDEAADVWYFAYGSNMNVAQLLSRIGNFEEKKLMALENFDLRFNKKMSLKKSSNAVISKCSFANVVSMHGETVFGISYKVTKRQLEQMDTFEGTRNGHYNREMMMCLDCDSKKYVECAVYIAPPEACADGLLPTDSYLSNLLGGKSMLPPYYVDRLLNQESINSRDIYNAVF